MTRTAIVTGAAQGIGAAIAERLAKDGFTVLRLDRAYQIEVEDRWPFDLADIARHAALVDRITARHGHIDVLINNAGIASPKRGDFLELQPETFDAVMDVNLRGTVFFTQAVMKAMLAVPSPQRRTIQFVTSASATAASVERLDYCMSKAGLSMFAKGLAIRLAAEGIDVFELRPGIVRTDMTAGVTAKYDALIAGGLVPEKRWGEAADVASVAASIASGALPFSTGSVIDIGGGLTLPRF